MNTDHTHRVSADTAGVQYRAHVESDEQTDESWWSSEDLFILVRKKKFSRPAVDRAPVEVVNI